MAPFEHSATPERVDALTRRKKHFAHKHRVAQVFRLAGMDNVANDLDACEETQQLVFCCACSHAWYVPKKCRKRVCPLCSYREAKARARYVQAMTAHMQYPKMITLTMPTWTGDPKEGIAFIRDAFSKMRRAKLFRRVIGGAYQIELKRKPTGWHIHIHTILDAPFIPRQHIWSLWRTLINVDVPQVNVIAASDPKAREYVCKYLAKASGFEHDLTGIVEWYKCTIGVRLFGTFGKWFNATLEDLEDGTEKPTPPPTCPQCGASHTIYPARAGPTVFGKDAWHAFANACLQGQPYEMSIPWAQDIVRGTRQEIRETVDLPDSAPVDRAGDVSVSAPGLTLGLFDA